MTITAKTQEIVLNMLTDAAFSAACDPALQDANDIGRWSAALGKVEELRAATLEIEAMEIAP